MSESFLLIARPPQIVTAMTGEYRGFNRVFQHIARFIYVTTTGPAHSYGRRSPGLQFEATYTPPFHLPALGRHQPLYVGLRRRRDLCFW